MSTLNIGGIPLDAELVDADYICPGDRIVRNRRVAEVTRVKDYMHMNDDTLEFRVFTEARGYETFMTSSRTKIIRVVETYATEDPIVVLGTREELSS